jgi:5-formyltetrahydrofolate cyclo-ligase
MKARRIGIYLSMPNSELQTAAIVRHALQNGKKVFVPYLHKSDVESAGVPKSIMDMVDLYDIADFESLQRDSWGIPTIDESSVEKRQRVLGNIYGAKSERVALDLILMPGVAFSEDVESGYIRRLGHGKGFYDFFLQRYFKDTKNAVSLSERPGLGLGLYALGLQEQLLDANSNTSVPVGPQDSLINGLITGDGKVRHKA